ncbi:TIGR02536 family ethanolamine utilization protein [Clostridium sediminicola]|uniref:hypothetical protein n=1 Tax=Clostridium sediminicola TaxID=3114879 RepID=UPI0031F22EED
MDLEKLVDMITKEVMRKIKESMESENSIVNRPSILIVESSQSDIYSNLVSKIDSNKYLIHSKEDMNSNLDSYDNIIIGSINNRELANLALGVQFGEKEKIIIDSILLGKDIFLVEEGIEYRKYKDKANKIFYSLYREYENKLINYGIKLVKEDIISKISSDKKINNIERIESIGFTAIENKEDNTKSNVINDEMQIFDFSKKRLITEAELRKAFNKGMEGVKLSSKTILTPLVKDFIRMNNIKIIQIK